MFALGLPACRSAAWPRCFGGIAGAARNRFRRRDAGETVRAAGFRRAQAAPADQPLADASRIAAVVNGDVISEADIGNRARLFAISTGLPLSHGGDRPAEAANPAPVDRRAAARAGSPAAQDRHPGRADRRGDQGDRNPQQHAAGALRAKLASDGVSTRTLIDQIRAQLAWTQMLRESIGEKINITDADVAEQQKLAAQQVGQTEYRLGEIFIPVDDPPTAPTPSISPKRSSPNCTPAPRSRWSPPSSARPRPRWKAASSAGCRPTSSTPRWPASSARCRSARSAIQCGSRAASRSSRCRPSGRSATKSPPSRRCARPSFRSPPR